MLDAQDWTFPVHIAYGIGRLQEIGAICTHASMSRPLIVTDRGSRDLPFIEGVALALQQSGIAFDLFAEISPNPRDDEYVMGENPAMSDPNASHARAALAKLDHLVVQDLFLTETAKYADVVLPASAWPEKDGTVTNTYRQVQRRRAALPLPGEARQDWWIIQEIAKRIGLDWNYDCPADVFAEMKQGMNSLDNITWERLTAENSVTYPCDAPDRPGNEIVFAESFPTVSGRAKFTPAEVVPPDELPDADYPMVLTTGRQLEHWHTGSMTRRASKLDALEPEANASLHPKQLESLISSPATPSASRRAVVRSRSWRGPIARSPRG